MAGSSIRNPIGPHRSQRNIVTISRKEEGRRIVVSHEESDDKRPVRGAGLFRKNFAKNIDQAKEGREDEYPEDIDTA